MKHVQPEICQKLSPELYNRFEVAPFKGLNEDLLNKLVNKLLDEVKELVQKKKKITLHFDSSLVDYLKQAGYSPDLGARPLKRLIQQEVITLLAKEIIKGAIQQGDTPHIYYIDGKVVCRN